MLNSIGWPSINQLCAKTRLEQIWKAYKYQRHPNSGLFKIKSNVHYSLRSNNEKMQINESNYRSVRSFSLPTAKLWNLAPKEIRETNKISTAKQLIENFARKLPL